MQYTSFSLPSLFDYDVKIPNVTFYTEYNQVNDEILFPFLNLNMVLRNSTPAESSPTFDRVNAVGSNNGNQD